MLINAIEELYGEWGVSCEFRAFDSIDELSELCPVIATIKFALFVDHYVVVFEVKEDRVIVGDPLKGRYEITREDFRKLWRFKGITFERKGKPATPPKRPERGDDVGGPIRRRSLLQCQGAYHGRGSSADIRAFAGG